MKKPLIINLVKQIFYLLQFVASFCPILLIKEMLPFSHQEQMMIHEVSGREIFKLLPFLTKRQLSWDMRFLWDWYDTGNLAKPVCHLLWNQWRCKWDDCGLSSERMPGETKPMTTGKIMEKNQKHHHYYPHTVNKIQHYSLPVYTTVVLHLSHR